MNKIIDTDKYSAIEIYEFVLSGTLKKFPQNFWLCEWSHDYFDYMYPNRLKPWEFKTAPRGFWDNPENIKDAVTWLISERLKGNIEYFKENFSTQIFIENDLGGMISRYKGIPYKYFLDIYEYDWWHTLCKVKQVKYKLNRGGHEQNKINN